MVPRKDFDDVTTQLESVRESFEELKQDFTTLNMEEDMIQESYKQSLCDKQGISEDLERLKGSATPRPLWDRSVTLDIPFTPTCNQGIIYKVEFLKSMKVWSNPSYPVLLEIYGEKDNFERMVK